MLQRIDTLPVEAKRRLSISPFLLGAGDFFLLNISFFLLNWWKRESLDLSSAYLKLLLLSYLGWLVVTLFTKKFRVSSYKGYWGGIFMFARSGLYAVYLVSFVVVLMGLSGFSRIHVFGIWFLLAIQEGLLFSLYYRVRGKSTVIHEDEESRTWERHDLSRFLLVSDFLLVVLSFFILNYLKRGHLYLSLEYEQLLLTICGLWFVSSMITRKFEKRIFLNYYHAIWPWLMRSLRGLPSGVFL